MLNHQRKFSVTCLTLVCLGIHVVSTWAQTTVSTTPNGYFTLTIPAGTGVGSNVTVLSLPLQGVAAASGQMAGVITSLTANTITNSNAGWTASQLSAPITPYLLQVTSGTAAGRTFLLSTSTANTATTVTLDPTDATQTNLTTLGIVAGTDTYQIIPADTISNIFGTPATTGILGGTSPTTPTPADRVQILLGNGWNSFYYNTNTNHWTLTSFPNTVGDYIVIRPDTGVVYNRYGNTALSLVVTGQVPSVARQATVANNGIAVISNNWPVDQTLTTSNIQNLPGWLSGSSSTNADLVQILAGNGWQQYYYNGSHWILVAFPHTQGDSVTIPAGSIAYILKKGTTSGYSILTQALPYSL